MHIKPHRTDCCYFSSQGDFPKKPTHVLTRSVPSCPRRGEVPLCCADQRRSACRHPPSHPWCAPADRKRPRRTRSSGTFQCGRNFRCHEHASAREGQHDRPLISIFRKRRGQLDVPDLGQSRSGREGRNQDSAQTSARRGLSLLRALLLREKDGLLPDRSCIKPCATFSCSDVAFSPQECARRILLMDTATRARSMFGWATP